jgi:hypothetical protein
MEATKVAQLTGLNRNSVNLYFRHFRRRLAQLCEAESPLRGEVEIDESYFGGRRIRGKRGRGAFKSDSANLLPRLVVPLLARLAARRKRMRAQLTQPHRRLRHKTNDLNSIVFQAGGGACLFDLKP